MSVEELETGGLAKAEDMERGACIKREKNFRKKKKGRGPRLLCAHSFGNWVTLPFHMPADRDRRHAGETIPKRNVRWT